MRGSFHIIGAVLALLAAIPSQAGEFTVLANGSRLLADRHDSDGTRVRLFYKGGETSLPASLIVRFEEDGAPEPTPTLKTPVPLQPAPQPPPLTPKTPAQMATAAAQAFALPEAFVRSVMRAESGFQPLAISPKGAIGLMQLMPDTARDLGVNPHDPEQNALGGAKYLHDLLARYEGNPDQVILALAAYNAGPAAVEKYHGVPPYAETRQYIWRVVNQWVKENGPR